MEEGINEGPTLCRIQAPSRWANSREESLRPGLDSSWEKRSMTWAPGWTPAAVKMVQVCGR